MYAYSYKVILIFYLYIKNYWKSFSSKKTFVAISFYHAFKNAIYINN